MSRGDHTASILLATEDAEVARHLLTLLRDDGRAAQWTRSGDEALRAARGPREPDLVLLDLEVGRATGMDGLETLRRLRAQHATLPVVGLASPGSVAPVVQAMKLGAVDILTKPLDPEAILAAVRGVLQAREDVRQGAPIMVGRSPAFCEALQLAQRFAIPEINILLVGETGTGKELFARTIHACSPRAAGPFVAVDCSTLAETLIESELFGHEKGSFTGATASRIGRFELAQDGTLFLDEIGNLPLPLQAKLLRVLQTRQLERVGGREPISLDVRVVAATNVNIPEAIAAGRFRQDLYFRLQEMIIRLPALREREGDVRRGAEHFVRVYARRFELPVRRIAPAALDILERYDWPGNMRELESAMKAAVVMATDVVLPEHLPAHVRGAAGGGLVEPPPVEGGGTPEKLHFEFEVGVDGAEVDLKALGARAAEQAERSLLRALLGRGLPSSAHLARMLSVDPKTLRHKLRRYGLDGQVEPKRTVLDAAAAATGPKPSQS
jgi:two-component system response regulator AtoC